MAKTQKKVTKEVETAAKQDAQVETTEAATTEPVQLTIADLQLLARIVDLASRRGAFQAAELTQVGGAFNKLSSFLSYVESQQTKDGETAEDSAEETAEQGA